MHSSVSGCCMEHCFRKFYGKCAKLAEDQLKLRVSYGSNGNQAISPYQTLDRLHLTNYIWGDGGAGVNGAYLANDGVGNPESKVKQPKHSTSVSTIHSSTAIALHGNIEMYVANKRLADETYCSYHERL